MSFKALLSGYLTNATNDGDYFLKSLTSALNGYANELSMQLSIPCFAMSGTLTLPNGATSPFSNPRIESFKMVSIKLDKDMLKSLLYKEYTENVDYNTEPFTKIFSYFGQQFSLGLKMLNPNPSGFTLVAPMSPIPTTSFDIYGRKFTECLYSDNIVDDKNPLRNRDVFIDNFDKFLRLAINNIPPMTVMATGSYIPMSAVFNGTILLDFSRF